MADFNVPSFAKGSKAAPVETTEAPVVEAPEVQDVTEDTPKAPRKKLPEITGEDEKFIVANITTMSYKDIADARGLETIQVSNVLQGYKKDLRAHAVAKATEAGVEAYEKTEKTFTKKGVKVTKVVDDYDKPLTDVAKAIEKTIAEKLQRPESTRVGGGAKKKEQPKERQEILTGLLDGI